MNGVRLGIAHVVSQTLIALAVVICVTLLGLQGTLDAAAVTGVLGAVVGIAGGLTAAKVGADLGNSPPTPPPAPPG